MVLMIFSLHLIYLSSPLAHIIYASILLWFGTIEPRLETGKTDFGLMVRFQAALTLLSGFGIAKANQRSLYRSSRKVGTA